MILHRLKDAKLCASSPTAVWLRAFHPSSPRFPRRELPRRRRPYKLSLLTDNDTAGQILRPISRKLIARRFRNVLRNPALASLDSNGKLVDATNIAILGGTIARQHATTEALEAELTYVANNDPHIGTVQPILNILIHDRLVIPSARHYEALILANSHPDGSCSNVHGILKAMERERISKNVGIYSAILKVLAIHPDHDFRNEILSEMRDKWVPVTSEQKRYIIAGMIREGQLELAWTEMEKLQAAQHNDQIDLWLWVLFVHSLCDHGDFDAVMHYIYHLQDQGVELPKDSWHYLLEKAAPSPGPPPDTTALSTKATSASQTSPRSSIPNAGSLELTSYIWTSKVEPKHIDPSGPLCDAVLRLAAHHVDRSLAESAVLVLEAKGELLSEPQGEPDREPFGEPRGKPHGEGETLSKRQALLAKAQGLPLGQAPLEIKPPRGNLWPLFSVRDGSDRARFSAYDAMRELLWEAKRGNKYRLR